MNKALNELKEERTMSAEKRLKCVVFGLPESGKTWFTLSFPNIIHIDMEGGAEHYHDKFNLAYFFNRGSAILKSDSWPSSNVIIMLRESRAFVELIMDS